MKGERCKQVRSVGRRHKPLQFILAADQVLRSLLRGGKTLTYTVHRPLISKPFLVGLQSPRGSESQLAIEMSSHEPLSQRRALQRNERAHRDAQGEVLRIVLGRTNADVQVLA